MLAVLVALPVGMAPSSAYGSTPGPTFTINGTGLGHGIGLSQYGAYGAALAGKKYDWILKHYYSGTTVGKVSIPRVKVNIDAAYRPGRSYAGRSSWTMKSVGSSLTVRKAGSTAKIRTLRADTFYRFTSDGTNVTIRTEGGAHVASYAHDISIVSSGSPRMIQVKDQSTSINGAYQPPKDDGTPQGGFTNVRYRGIMHLSRVSSRLSAVNDVPMYQYLYGVLPREMYASWHAEALKAQAVAARSYAYADVAAGRVLACTTHSQVYKGHSRVSGTAVIPHEDSRSNSAVTATTDRVVRYGTRVVKAFFFSRSGGHTANNEDVWVSGTPLPEMRGVPDTYEHLAKPPNSPWAPRTMTGLDIASRLRGLGGVPASTSTYVTSVQFDRAASGHARYVTFRFSNGASARLAGDTVRSKLGPTAEKPLGSTHFYITGFPTTRIEGSTRYATAVEISKRAFPAGAPAVVLATGEDHPDALAGSALAGVVRGPVLLTRTAGLPAVVSTELGRLKPSTVYLMGGTLAIDAEVEKAVRAALPSARIERLDGATRFDTALDAARRVMAAASPSKVVVVEASAWADAAAVSPITYTKSYPVLLVKREDVGDSVRAFLGEFKPDTILLIGGDLVISDAVRAEMVSTGAQVVELQGATRYHTAAAVATYGTANEGLNAGEVYIATGKDFPDALAGGVLAGLRRNPLLLTSTHTCPTGTSAYLTANKSRITRLNLFGGHLAISPAGANELDSVMMR